MCVFHRGVPSGEIRDLPKASLSPLRWAQWSECRIQKRTVPEQHWESNESFQATSCQQPSSTLPHLPPRERPNDL